MRTLYAAASITLWAAACSSIRVQMTPPKPAQKICQNSGENLNALVLWRPQWRPDQKEPATREAAAQQGLKDFLRASRCFNSAKLERTDATSVADYLRSPTTRAQKYLHITVRELGPVVRVFSSLALLEGGTEVVLEIEISDAMAVGTEKYRVHWQDGGPWTLKGVQTLSADMTAALVASLE